MRGSGRPPTRFSFAIVLSACVFLGTPALASAAGVAAINDREPTLVDRINEVREGHGLSPLKVVSRLDSAAARHAKNMGYKGYFRHELRYKGSWKSFGTWISWYWPGPDYSSWSAGENVAWGTPELGAQQTVTMWMNSPGHRANILGAWTRIGVAFVHVTDPGGYYSNHSEVTIAVADFGRRSG